MNTRPSPSPSPSHNQLRGDHQQQQQKQSLAEFSEQPGTQHPLDHLQLKHLHPQQQQYHRHQQQQPQHQLRNGAMSPEAAFREPQMECQRQRQGASLLPESKMDHYRLRHLSPVYELEHKGQAFQPQGQPLSMHQHQQQYQSHLRQQQHQQQQQLLLQHKSTGEGWPMHVLEYDNMYGPQGLSHFSQVPPHHLQALPQAPLSPDSSYPMQPPVYQPQLQGQEPLPVQRSHTQPLRFRPRHMAPLYHAVPNPDEQQQGTWAVGFAGQDASRRGHTREASPPAEADLTLPLAIATSDSATRGSRSRRGQAAGGRDPTVEDPTSDPQAPATRGSPKLERSKKGRAAGGGDPTVAGASRSVTLGRGVRFVDWSGMAVPSVGAPLVHLTQASGEQAHGNQAVGQQPEGEELSAEGEGLARPALALRVPSLPSISSCDGRLEGAEQAGLTASPHAAPLHSPGTRKQTLSTQSDPQPTIQHTLQHTANQMRRGTSLPTSRHTKGSARSTPGAPPTGGRNSPVDSMNSTVGTVGSMNSSVLPCIASLSLSPGKSCLKQEGCPLGAAKQVSFNGIVSVRKYLTRGHGK